MYYSVLFSGDCQPGSNFLLLQVSVNGQIHEVGWVVIVQNETIAAIVCGIIVALIVGAGLAFLVMYTLRKKKKKGKKYGGKLEHSPLKALSGK